MSGNKTYQKIMRNLEKHPTIKKIATANLKHKMTQRTLQYYKTNRDIDELEHTIPSSDEKFEYQCSWIIEVYPPSYTKQLVSSLKKLGLDGHQEGVFGGHDDIVEWLQQSRSLSGKFASQRVEFGQNVPMPTGVDFANGWIYTVGSSLTILVVQFVYKDETLACLDETLSKSYSSKLEYKRSRFKLKESINTALNQKTERITDVVNDRHERLFTWFANYLPGYFSTTDETKLPVTDFFTGRKIHPLSSKLTIRDTYLDLLCGSKRKRWQYIDKKIELELRSEWSTSDDSQLLLYGNFDDLVQDLSENEDSNIGRFGIHWYLNDRINKTLVWWATHHLLISYEKQLSNMRDSAISHISGDRSVIDNLQFIRRQFLLTSTDIKSTVKTLGSNSQISYVDLGWGTDFQDFHHEKDKFPSLLNALQNVDKMRIETLEVLEAEIKESIITGSNIASAVINLRIQIWLFWLTILTLIITIVTAQDAISKILFGTTN